MSTRRETRRKGIPLWAAGLFFFLLTGLRQSSGQAFQNLSGPVEPQAWIEWSLYLEKLPIDLLNRLSGSLRPEAIRPSPDYHSPYDRIADVEMEEGRMAVAWESAVTGEFPDPRSLEIRASLNGGDHRGHYRVHYREENILGKIYFKTTMQFALVSPEGEPLRRGYVEILKDTEEGTVNVASTTINGPETEFPDAMLQISIRVTRNKEGWSFVRKEEGQALVIPETQEQLCRSPEGTWVANSSEEWETRCAPLFDGSRWHGFSLSRLPAEFKSFL